MMATTQKAFHQEYPGYDLDDTYTSSAAEFIKMWEADILEVADDPEYMTVMAWVGFPREIWDALVNFTDEITYLNVGDWFGTTFSYLDSRDNQVHHFNLDAYRNNYRKY